jgi:putative two-component system response regulator
MVSNVLHEAGHEVFRASDGLRAMKLLHKYPIQLVISDWSMPNMDGIELCRAIRGANFGRYVYFILLTCHSQPDDTLNGLTAGADDFIIKPFNPMELILRVKVGQRTIALDTRDLTIYAMGKLAESRDSETGEHLDRICNYCRILGQRLQGRTMNDEKIDDEFLEMIQKTSPLHDIGKIAIPDCILQKPDKLDENEFGIIKMHTVFGARMLDAALREFPNANFLSMAKDIALTHHERYDGGGYPQGLSGKSIPLAGRIVALADVYDALTTKRIYKNAFSHAAAASIITEKSKGQFDPLVIEAFLAEEKQFTEIRAQYVEEEIANPFKNLAAVFALPNEMESFDDDSYISSLDRR